MDKPPLGEPKDLGRLFVRCIIDERARDLFGNNLQHIMDMPCADRWGRLLEAAEANDDEDAPDASKLREMRQIVIEVLSDVEAWIVVERARKGARA
jgi:hypothetical protein